MDSESVPCPDVSDYGDLNIRFLSDKRLKTSGKNIIDLLGDNHYNFERTKRRYECL